MVNENHPQIVFVDGPTGVGKDYFIDKLYDELVNKYELSVEVVRAADFTVVSKETASEDRKYEFYSTKDKQVHIIFEGHKELLSYLDNVLIEGDRDVDVILVNRSFISFLVYNMHQEERVDLREEFIHQYRRKFLDRLSRYDTLFIGLFLEDGGKTPVEGLLARIGSRNDGKPIDEYWIETLVKNYTRSWCVINDIVGDYEMATSNDYVKIADKYFKSL